MYVRAVGWNTDYSYDGGLVGFAACAQHEGGDDGEGVRGL